ncbi:hypothetical protein [Bartonella rattimassiliensis]|uniref:hypothetical protein n=1 Tax=Bartonella rattimassiliensis TaxID=270250 RepID=UPI0002E0E6AD|nr:hypothetical protein [Bartonella rattimassiliensis]
MRFFDAFGRYQGSLVRITDNENGKAAISTVAETSVKPRCPLRFIRDVTVFASYSTL